MPRRDGQFLLAGRIGVTCLFAQIVTEDLASCAACCWQVLNWLLPGLRLPNLRLLFIIEQRQDANDGPTTKDYYSANF